jgi:hypothetical protein
MATIIKAGNAASGFNISGDNTGTLAFKTGTGAGTTALTLSSAQVATFASDVISPLGTLYPIVSGTAVASTSGTSIDFTSIPSWVKRITVMFQGVSTGTASNPPLAFQLGTSSGVTTSGYLGSGGSISGAGAVNTVANFSANFQFIQSSSAANISHGQIIFNNISGNNWTCSGTLGQSDTNRISWFAGSIALGGVLDRVRITTAGGTDTFDAGSINILYE